MDATEVKRLGKDLTKSVNDGKYKDAGAIMETLKKGVVATEAFLRDTKIGITVGKLRKHESRTVSEAAKDLVKKWSSEVKKAPASKSKADHKTERNGVSPATDSPSTSTPTSPVKGASGADGFSGILPAPMKDGKVDFNYTGESIRDSCLKLIFRALELAEGTEVNLLFKRAVDIEKAVLKLNKEETSAAYRGKMRSLYLNLKDKSNPELRKRVISGEISSMKLATMTPQEMASEERRQEDKEIKMQNMFKSEGATQQHAETGAFRCGRCKQRKCTYFQLQTRSADEPMTTFITCVNCGNKWKD